MNDKYIFLVELSGGTTSRSGMSYPQLVAVLIDSLNSLTPTAVRLAVNPT